MLFSSSLLTLMVGGRVMNLFKTIEIRAVTTASKAKSDVRTHSLRVVKFPGSLCAWWASWSRYWYPNHWI